MTSLQKEIINRYLAADLSYVAAFARLVAAGMDSYTAGLVLDQIDEECDYD